MTVNTQELRELLKKSCIDSLYIRTNRHADTGGKRWGWTSTQPPGSCTSSFDLYWAEGDCTEARAQLVVTVINALPALLDENDALRGERGVLADILRDALGPLQVDLLNAEADGDCEDSRDLRAIIDRAEAALNPPAPPQGETACASK